MTDLARRRTDYAREVCSGAEVGSEAVLRAFATVPREDYLGKGPWRLLRPELLPDGYETTPDDDPVHLYQNVLVAIDEERWLNNGQPSVLAKWIDLLAIGPGDRVLHIGCGVGYYSAIMAEIVGPRGHLAAVEIDPALAARARTNLSSYPHVEVLHADGGICEAGPRNAIFVNAGATHPQPLWLSRLAPGGRLLFPLTVSLGTGEVGGGHMLRVMRTEAGYAARFVSPVGVFPCAGARESEAERRLRKAYSRGEEEFVQELRVDIHSEEPSCWLHNAGWCLSKRSFLRP
ncbi:MAG TPA: rRNA adenine N-6-methyltransferase family protein [Myxococcota bacterium]|nr:rRNA adenine N-6-methyltransferase family protein [Myxococcota bacterium]